MSALFDFPSLLTVILLFICTTTLIRLIRPGIFDDSTALAEAQAQGVPISHHHRRGVLGLCWRASRIGERLSPYVAIWCIIMSFHILFIKP